MVPTSSTTDALRQVMGTDEHPDALARAKLLEEVRLGLFGEHAQTHVGRYRMIERLGGGGQGVVWVARDPDLQRDVAIKILRSEGKRHPHAHRRLLREAAALARLSHPNVVAVNDVGECELGVYVVTELVVGKTLAEWLAAGHPWREVLAAFLDAGQGLVAAHAQGIVHRDFKPANVLIGEDGRARLLDFGLAREADTSVPSDSGPGERTAAASGRSSGPSSGASATVTRPGTAMGTPAYMAPEQHAGVAADFAADQFAFCASLYEGLFGQRPYPQKSIGEIAAAKLAGRMAPAPKGTTVPWALHGVVVRGLSANPSRRYSSMQALLTALRHAARPRRRWTAIALGVTAIATTAAIATFATSDEPTPMPATVTAHSRDRESPPAHLALEVAALRQRIELGKSLATAGDLERAKQILYTSERDASDLRFVPTLVDARIAYALVLHLTGDREQSMTLMESAYFAAEANGQGLMAFTAARHLVQFHGSEAGNLLQGQGWLRRAEAIVERLGDDVDPMEHGLLLQTAADLSSRAGDHELALAQARGSRQILENELDPDDPRRIYSIVLVARTLLFLGQLDEAWAEAQRALQVAEDTVGPNHLSTARAINVLALVAKHRGDFQQALDLQQRALELHESMPDPDEATIAGTLGNMGVLYSETGRPAEAEAAYRRALEIQRTHLGDDDPIVARTLHNLAITVHDRGRSEEALGLWRDAIGIATNALGPDHPETTAFEFMYALMLTRADRASEARPMIEHALATARAQWGNEHPETAQRLAGLADVQRRLGETEEAGKNMRRAYAQLSEALGPDHPEVGRLQFALGMQLEVEGELEAALVQMQRALQIFEASLGPSHNEVAESLYVIARVQLALGHRREADEAVRRADAIIEATQGSAPPT